MPTYDTQDIRAKDIAHQIHPWTDFATFKDAGSLVLAEADGAFVIDSDGNRYLDGIGGLWCVNVGYGRKEIAQAMAEQAGRMVYYSSFGAHTSIPAAELAHKLAALAPGGLSHIQFGTGGSMANDTAVRMIHFYFNRLGQKSKKKIITRHDGYHGSTYLAMSLTGVAFDHQGFDIIDDGLIHRVSAPNTYRRRPAYRRRNSAMSWCASSKPKSWSWGLRMSPPSSPSRLWAPAASSSPRQTTTRACEPCAANTACCMSPTKWSPASAA